MVLKSTWIDRYREPQCKPNPAFPLGQDIDLTGGAEKFCSRTFSWPAKRCGYWYVECSECGTNALITTAGRPDDPRSVKIACKKKEADV